MDIETGGLERMKTTSLRVDGKVAVVTGAGQGIGHAYACGLAEAGASVVLADVDEANGAAAADKIRANGFEAMFVRTDVADEGSVRRLAVQLDERFGKVDILVNNAAVEGAPQVTPLADLDVAAYDHVMAVNVKGMWLMVRELLGLLRRADAGAVVNQGSIGAFMATGGYLPYNTSKNAIIGLTKTLARELGSDGIRVNSIAPGSIATESVKRAIPQELINEIVSGQCIAAHQQPEDLVGPLLFLVSDASRFITGQTLVVDGGVVMLP